MMGEETYNEKRLRQVKLMVDTESEPRAYWRDLLRTLKVLCEIEKEQKDGD